MRFLVVPIRVDAVCLTANTDVSGPSADFTLLPYVDAQSGRDVNPGTPFLSDAILPDPFDTGARLRPGVHLHWSLPDALTRMVGAVPRQVPNRWLVVRTGTGGDVDGRWLIESDALSDADPAGVPYPVMAGDPPNGSGRPWRRLGRVRPLAGWTGPAAEHTSSLTAFGYGEPAFAAFYPNSHSVFGFHDEQHASGPPTGVRYDVLGWYADPTRDELGQLLAGAGAAPWPDTVADTFGWAAPPGATAPDAMVCFGRLIFHSGALLGLQPPPGETGVCVADTPTEALAAHLGVQVPGTDPDALETLLEALAFADELESATADLPARLAQARHAASFGTVAGGTTWTVRRRDESGATVTAEEKQARDRLVLPATLPDLLDALNRAQAAYDRAGRAANGLRERLFADWHRYQTCAYPPDHGRDSYPDPDLVAAFLDRDLAALDDLVTRTGSLPPDGVPPAAPSGNATLADRVTVGYLRVRDVLSTMDSAATAARTAFVLEPAPAAPFHTPNEPVVLLTGMAATPSDRYGNDGAGQPDGLLPCVLVDAADLSTVDGMVGLAHAVSTVDFPPENPAVRDWTGPPWHPVLLRWEVEFYPAAAGNNLGPGGRNYAPDFVAANYGLPEDGVELVPTSAVPDRGANVYTGTTVLGATTRTVLSARILRYLQSGPLIRYNATAKAPLTTDDVAKDPRPLLDWCAGSGEPRLATLAAAYRHLDRYQDSNLAQSLGGFNDALVMLRLTRQVPVADPLGFPAGQDLAARMDAAIAGQSRHAPVPLSDFNPIRAGAMRLRRLRIVDNFGVGHDVDVSAPATSVRLRQDGRPGWIALPPRLAEPARLILHLLDADADRRPCVDLPASDPVCGWLMPDNLDDGLRVFAADGTWLGTLFALPDPAEPATARWEPPPGGNPAAVDNPHLRRVVETLRADGPERVGELLGQLDVGLEAVEPEEPAQHRARAVLFGRPIAVVRLSVGLETAGPPAVHQDWNVFREDLGRLGRESNGYPLVWFPVRIGEPGRLGDGVLGYWPESPDGGLGEYVDAPTAEGFPVRVAAGLPEQVLTVLLEPAGAIHATSGVLPTGTVRLAAEHHHDALARLETSFLAAPVLTDAATVTVPLPGDPDRIWSWREADRSGWVEVGAPGAPPERFPTDLTAREGWLVARPPAGS